MKRETTIGLVLILAATLLIVAPLGRDSHDEDEGKEATSNHLASKSTIRSDRSGEHSARTHQDMETESHVREQLAILLSEPSEEVSTDLLLKHCRMLRTSGAIKRLLTDPDFGWVPLSGRESRWSKAPKTELVLRQLYEALFERWGLLDFEGALDYLESTGTATPPEDYSDFWTPMASLYKGGAQVDGEKVSRFLFPQSGAGVSEFQNVMFKGLMEGWASSDPENSWNFLVNHHQQLGNGSSSNALFGYLDGRLDQANWDNLLLKVENFGAGEVGIRNSTIDMFPWLVRKEFAKRWVRKEPQAALAWLESARAQSSGGFHRRDEPTGFVELTEVVSDWIRMEPEKALEWLPSWKPQAVSAERVFRAIASNSRNPKAVRERAAVLAKEVGYSP